MTRHSLSGVNGLLVDQTFSLKHYVTSWPCCRRTPLDTVSLTRRTYCELSWEVQLMRCFVIFLRTLSPQEV